MIYPKRRQFLLLVVITLLTGFWSCVDIPSQGPPDDQFDFRSLVRFVHLAQGIDTITLYLRSDVDTTRTLSDQQYTEIVGSDTINVHDTTRVVTYPKQYYRRFVVDFSGSMNILEDGSQIASLSSASAGGYRNTPAGNRKVHLMMNGTLLDTVVIQYTDTSRAIQRDTVGRGSSRFDTAITFRAVTNLLPTGTIVETIPADSTSPTIVIDTDRKLSIFLIHDGTPLVSEEDGLIRYAVVEYVRSDERYRFALPTPADTFALRFVNASMSSAAKKVRIDGTYTILDLDTDRETTKTLTAMIDSLPFTSTSGFLYRKGTYSVKVFNYGSSEVTDSTGSLTIDGFRRITFAILDSASTFRLRRFDDD
ncbi:MAG: hypothetical protein HY707_03770 [Ignavibacteriae bacterium]|nr:hypothetical protein [Ignavibacteriota bacterium]